MCVWVPEFVAGPLVPRQQAGGGQPLSQATPAGCWPRSVPQVRQARCKGCTRRSSSPSIRCALPQVGTTALLHCGIGRVCMLPPTMQVVQQLAPSKWNMAVPAACTCHGWVQLCMLPVPAGRAQKLNASPCITGLHPAASCPVAASHLGSTGVMLLEASSHLMVCDVTWQPHSHILSPPAQAVTNPACTCCAGTARRPSPLSCS